MSPETTIAVHGQKLDTLEKWKEKHEGEDDKVHTAMGTDVSKLVTGFATLNETLKPIIKAYWGEDSSKVTNMTPVSSRKASRVTPELRQGGVIAALVAAVLALAEVVKAYAHPVPPPPPSPTEIATEVARAIMATQAVPSAPRAFPPPPPTAAVK